jgi:hypothetical protein
MKNFFRRYYDALRKSQNPWWRWTRQIVGVLMVIGGLLGFMPLIGFWMIPLGLGLLSVDWPIAKRAYKVLMSWWRRLQERVRQTRKAALARRTASTPGKRNGS